MQASLAVGTCGNYFLLFVFETLRAVLQYKTVYFSLDSYIVMYCHLHKNRFCSYIPV